MSHFFFVVFTGVAISIRKPRSQKKSFLSEKKHYFKAPLAVVRLPSASAVGNIKFHSYCCLVTSLFVLFDYFKDMIIFSNYDDVFIGTLGENTL